MINLENTLLDRQPALRDKLWAKYMFKVLKKLIREDEINYFIKTHQHLRGFAFLDKVLDYFNFSYQVSDKSLNNIPAEGRLIIIANHPIGSLDGLALLKLVHSVRPDSRIVANELLTLLEPLESLFLPVEVLSGKASYRSQFQAMLDALDNEQALIIFPAGEVSRINATGIRDGVWKTGFVKLAKKTQTPILPIFINAKNSTLFYSLSTLYKPLGTLLLVHEMFNKENQQLTFHVGKAIPAREVEQSDLSPKQLANRFKKHLYRLAKKHPKHPKRHKKINQDTQTPKWKKSKQALFNTVETVAHPARRQFLKRELYAAQLLGETDDGKKIFLYDYRADSAVMHEIGRLRELTFRTVEEGTGAALDIDRYDVYYRHLVL
ncbi:MAG TPA: GNAT family N-acetyltransferase, partial [Thiothrix sp.]|nr:GNAT family N-acetyltransferase [Thiothrix sp.]